MINFDKFMLTKVQVSYITDMAKTDNILFELLLKLEDSNDFGIQDMYLNKILNYVEDKRKHGLH